MATTKTNRTAPLIALQVVLVSAAALAAASAVLGTHAADAYEGRIDASGATFAYPLMDLWRVEYRTVDPDVSLNYNSIGSGGGVRNHIERLGQFGATEAPLNDGEAAAAPGTITIPAMIGAISLAYNIDGDPSGLNITSEALCGIFLGEIDRWSDPRITESNPGLALPDAQIITFHRSDGSGTTFAFTSYLAKTCPAWDEQIGAAKSVQWRSGSGLPGNEGVAGGVRTTSNSIGYVTLAYALQSGMAVASIENGDGTAFVRPTIESASAASEAASPALPEAHQSWYGVDLLATPGEDSYPITSFSYIILHPDLEGSTDSIDQARAVAGVIAWMVTDGQRFAPDLGYVPIADTVSEIGLTGLSKVTYGGEPVYLRPEADSGDVAVQDGPVAVPSWVKATAGWWAAGDISDEEFVAAIRYLISEEIIVVEAAAGEGDGDSVIPGWIKNTAGWWAAGEIPDDSFLNALKFLIRTGILVV